MPTDRSLLALDVGAARIGVAVARSDVRIASPLTTVAHDATISTMLDKLIAQTNAAVIVVGLPRGLDGQHTDQTRVIEAFVADLGRRLELPIYFQDEAVTSRQAEAELRARGKPFAKGDIDALAATYILEDFLRDHPEVLA